MKKSEEADPELAAFGRCLQQAREAAGMSLRDLSRALDATPYPMSDRNLIEIESGRRKKVSIFWAASAARVLGTSLDVLLGLAPDPRAEVLSTFASRVKAGGGSKILSKRTGVEAVEIEACVKGQPALVPSSVPKLAPVLEMDERELAMLRQDWKPSRGAGRPSAKDSITPSEPPEWLTKLDQRLDRIENLLSEGVRRSRS